MWTGMLTMTACSGTRSRSAAAASTSACVSASSNCATAVRKRCVSHSRGCSSTEISSILATKASLFGAHEERKAVHALDDDLVPGVRTLVANRLPALPADAHATPRPAVAHDNPRGAQERLGADLGTPALRKPDPDPGLTQLDRHADDDCRDPPARRQDEHGQEDGED